MKTKLVASKDAAIAYRKYAEAQIERYTQRLQETQRLIDHFKGQVGECDYIITGLKFDGSPDDVERARAQGYEIEYAFGNIYYCEPKKVATVAKK